MTAPLAAVLWDMDGLLVDSEPLWTVAETEMAAALGRTWSDEIKAACMGRRLDTAVPIMLAALDVAHGPDEVAWAERFLLDRMVGLLSTGAPVLPGALDLLDELRAEGVPCALVSSSFRVLVDAVLTDLGPERFAATVAGDEVAHAKPAPDPYRQACERLGVDPARCVALEDSLAGATSATAAGAGCIVVPGPHSGPVPGPWHVRGTLVGLRHGDVAAALPDRH
ncbi:MAG TPA: HAD family phosphatase [Mycobacteriales bacterium]|nr:HAD family phosphatase [Mycobacteriales bacterium]